MSYLIDPLGRFIADKNLLKTNTVSTDIKAEIIAAELFAEGESLENIIIDCLGSFGRNRSKDIAEIKKTSIYTADEQTRDLTLLEVNRETIFEGLPENLFFNRDFISRRGLKTDILDQIKLHRKDEKFVRLFFLPFTAELHYFSIAIYYYEYYLDYKQREGFFETLRPMFPILKKLNPQQSSIFLYAIPIIHQVRGNFEWLQEFLTLLFAVPFRYSFFKAKEKVEEKDFTSTLGNCSLGSDSVIGNEFSDGTSNIKLHIGPLSSHSVAHFLPHSFSISLVKEVCDYFIPAGLTVTHEILVNRAEVRKSTVNNDPFQRESVYLGYNSFF